MTYRIPLPSGARRPHLDLIEPNSTEVQRLIRRDGLAAYEPPTAAALLALCDLAGPGFVMYDVGSNMGLYSHLVASVFAPARVVAFEPAPATAAVSRAIGKRNGLAVDVIEAAVSDSPGSAELFFSPISDASNSLSSTFRHAVGSTLVDVVTIDRQVASTGLDPDVMKIDVETFEPEVLRGARGTLERCRPPIVIEALPRRDRYLGAEIAAEIHGLEYHCYPLTSSPTWEPVPKIHGLGTADRDWLLLPEPITPAMIERWQQWGHALGEITVDRNPRVPLMLSTRAAFGRGGASEVVASGRRYAESVLARLCSR
ncbi:MAG: FkbM family methyltransferase [Actinomycetota bacterium]